MSDGATGPVGGFRNAPPEPQSDWITRTRLQQRLERRFELDVLLVAAPAGYGKTSALSRTIANNELDPIGTDLWLQCSHHDSDPAVLAAAIMRSTGLEPPEGDWQGTGATLADALLRFAPHPVCLVLDDTHLIDSDSMGMALLQDLVEALPDHAHVLLAGRTIAPLRLARLRLDGRCEQLGLADFEFDDTEMDLALGGQSQAEIARWPAMSRLLRADRPNATVDYLLEEVASALGPERLAALTALSNLREVDDSLALAASDGGSDATSLLGGLPLVLRSPTGAFQMHDLWTEALVGDGPLTEAAAASLSRVAESLLQKRQYVYATEQFVRASNAEGVHRASLQFVQQPLMFTSAAELRAMAELAGSELGSTPLAQLLRATVPITGDEVTSAVAFREAARVAREAGDLDVEIIALQNLTSLQGVIDPSNLPAWLVERIYELDAGDHPRVEALQAMIGAMSARTEGDSIEAARHLSLLNPQASPLEQVLHAFGMSDLGRPEEISAPSMDGDANEAASRAGGQFLAQAIWLRGDVSPELALELGSNLVDATNAQGVAHVQISTSSVLAFVALAAGDATAARRFTDSALSLCSHTMSPAVRAFAFLADAATVLMERGEQEAATKLAAALEIQPFGLWPSRPYFYALPFIYVAAPETRATLDGCQFGPALNAVRDAGAALVALREHGDRGPAERLSWHRADLLRAHVLPPQLAELAIAAAAAGNHDALGVLDAIPRQREYLLHVAGSPTHPGAPWAAERADRLPARPAHDISVELLGPIRLLRGEAEATDPGWVRRDRVRQLLAFLVLHRRTPRRVAAEQLWPDLTSDKAMANLRVNLSHLHRVLEPGRATDGRPWFIRSDNEFITLHDDGLHIDAVRFENECARARQLDDAGQGTRAIDLYRSAGERYQGDYAIDWPDAVWAEVERVRLRTLALSSMARVGELLLARGQPEEAGAWASRVIRTEPLEERAHRLFAQSLAAQGNRIGAARSLATLADRVEAEGLSLERETERVAASYGAIRPRPR